MSSNQRQLISSGAPWEPIVGYSRAVRAGNLVFVAGTAAVDEHGAVVGPGDAGAQTACILQKIERALHEAGGTMADVVRTRIFVVDIARDWEAIGRAHGERFRHVRPATSMVEVRALIDLAMLVEIEADAILPDPPRAEGSG